MALLYNAFKMLSKTVLNLVIWTSFSIHSETVFLQLNLVKFEQNICKGKYLLQCGWACSYLIWSETKMVDINLDETLVGPIAVAAAVVAVTV